MGGNWVLKIEYDGADYRGWQKQPGGLSIQNELEKALGLLLRRRIRVNGAGRTDAGVHALGQTANFRTDVLIDPGKLVWRLNAILPPTIAVREAAPVPDDFDARRSAVSRTYKYLILNRPYPSVFWRHRSWWVAKPLDRAAIERAGAALIGVHDFAGFTVAKEKETKRHLTELRFEQLSVEAGLFAFSISANAFLHHMVRLIVGTLVKIGSGKLPEEEVARILAGRDVRRAGPRAPAKGLVLERVDYAAPAG